MYYDWNCLHDKWLNDVMKDKLRVMEGLGRMDFPNIQTMARPHQVQKILPTTTRAFRVHYDIVSKYKKARTQ